jgi:RNA polymerase sigma-70 factor (ECF subfamily)
MASVSYSNIIRRAKGLLVWQTMKPERPLAGLSDEELVERCRNRDHDAFTEIVERYKSRVHWLVIRMIGSSNVEDITQDVFLRAYQAIEGYRGDSTFRTWLYRITRNLCVTHLRKKGSHGGTVSIEEEGEEAIHNLLPESPVSLEDEIERRDLSAAIQTLMARLPEKYRTVLTLFYLQQVRYEEIADIMGIPLGTVKTYIHRARLRLRDLILAESDLAGLVDTGDSTPPEGGSA